MCKLPRPIKNASLEDARTFEKCVNLWIAQFGYIKNF